VGNENDKMSGGETCRENIFRSSGKQRTPLFPRGGCLGSCIARSDSFVCQATTPIKLGFFFPKELKRHLDWARAQTAARNRTIPFPKQGMGGENRHNSGTGRGFAATFRAHQARSHVDACVLGLRPGNADSSGRNTMAAFGWLERRTRFTGRTRGRWN